MFSRFSGILPFAVFPFQVKNKYHTRKIVKLYIRMFLESGRENVVRTGCWDVDAAAAAVVVVVGGRTVSL